MATEEVAPAEDAYGDEEAAPGQTKLPALQDAARYRVKAVEIPGHFPLGH